MTQGSQGNEGLQAPYFFFLLLLLRENSELRRRSLRVLFTNYIHALSNFTTIVIKD